MKEVVQTSRFGSAERPYSLMVKAGGLLFISGLVSVDPDSLMPVGETVASQTERILTNLGLLLKDAGLGYEDVVKVTVFLHDTSSFAQMNEVFRKFFRKNPPARTTVGAQMISPEYLVEIDAIAVCR